MKINDCECKVKRNSFGYPEKCFNCIKVYAEHAEMLVEVKAYLGAIVGHSRFGCELGLKRGEIRRLVNLIARIEGRCQRCGKPKRGVHTCLEIVDDKD